MKLYRRNVRTVFAVQKNYMKYSIVFLILFLTFLVHYIMFNDNCKLFVLGCERCKVLETYCIFFFTIVNVQIKNILLNI